MCWCAVKKLLTHLTFRDFVLSLTWSFGFIFCRFWIELQFWVTLTFPFWHTFIHQLSFEWRTREKGCKFCLTSHSFECSLSPTGSGRISSGCITFRNEFCTVCLPSTTHSSAGAADVDLLSGRLMKYSSCESASTTGNSITYSEDWTSEAAPFTLILY